MSSTSNISVLGSSSPQDVRVDPYAYIVCESVFPTELYDRLAETFPSTEYFLKHLPEVKSNQAVRIPASYVIGSEDFSPEWREFFSYHTSDAFWQDIVRVFGDNMRATYPQLETQVGRPMEEWRAKLRGSDGSAELHTDLLFVINTPVKTPSSVRPAHVDSRNKIFSGLFYMKQAGDPTPGGDLAIYRFKDGHNGFGGHYANLEDLDETDVVGYGANKFIGFINSQDSIHGVTPRPETEWARRYINFVVETPFEAFQIPRLPLFQQWKSWLERRKNKSPGVDLKLGA